VDPAIKKRVDFYRSWVLFADWQTVPWRGDRNAELAHLIVHEMFEGNYEPSVIDTARECFHLDLENPCHERMLLFILAHVVFGRGQKRGRRRRSENWDSLKDYRLAVVYLELKSKNPTLSTSTIANTIAKSKEFRASGDIIRKRLSRLRKWIKDLQEMESEQEGAIRHYGELLLEAKRDLKAKLAY
jgi:hypothetical protein